MALSSLTKEPLAPRALACVLLPHRPLLRPPFLPLLLEVVPGALLLKLAPLPGAATIDTEVVLGASLSAPTSVPPLDTVRAFVGGPMFLGDSLSVLCDIVSAV